MTYDDTCSGCEISQGVRPVAGKVAALPGDWTVNQYGGGEGYLGWLALQPRYHRTRLTDLAPGEVTALGSNLQALDRVLTQYWTLQFPDDPIDRVYVAYFYESAFEDPPEPKPYHLHIHVIPRFRSLARPGALRIKKGTQTWNDAWQVPHLAERMMIPEPYARHSPMWENRATTLMDYLRHELQTPP